jgi:hypothetical protein
MSKGRDQPSDIDFWNIEHSPRMRGKWREEILEQIYFVFWLISLIFHPPNGFTLHCMIQT